MRLAITTLNEANQIDATRDPIWYELGDAYLKLRAQAGRLRGKNRSGMSWPKPIT